MCIELKDYERMISQQAGKARNRLLKTGNADLWSFEDLFNEGVMVFLTIRNKIECGGKYDEKKSAFSTFLCVCLMNKYSNIVRKSKKAIKTWCIDNSFWEVPDDKKKRLIKRDLEAKEMLSDDATLFLDCLFSPSDEFVYFVSFTYENGGRRKGGLVKPLIEWFGWTQDRYNGVRKELRRKIDF